MLNVNIEPMSISSLYVCCSLYTFRLSDTALVWILALESRHKVCDRSELVNQEMMRSAGCLSGGESVININSDGAVESA